MSRLQPQPRGISQAAPQTGGDHTARPAAPAEASAGFVLPVLALALGHMLSNGLRTLPAIAADRIQLGVTGSDLVREKLAGWRSDVVEIAPMSKTKNWRVAEIVARAAE